MGPGRPGDPADRRRLTLGGMTWAGRGARALVLALLSAVWALAAHRWAGSPGHGTGPTAAPLLWSTVATGLLAWWSLPAARRAGRRWGVLGGLLLLGQLLGHAALSLAPMLAGRTTGVASAAPALTEGPAHHPAVAVGGPPLDPDQVLAALTHASGPMLLAHVLASLAAALAWTAGGMLWRATLRWLSTVLAAVPRVRPTLPRLVPCPVGHVPGPPCVLAWDGRAPPRRA